LTHGRGEWSMVVIVHRLDSLKIGGGPAEWKEVSELYTVCVGD